MSRSLLLRPLLLALAALALACSSRTSEPSDAHAAVDDPVAVEARVETVHRGAILPVVSAPGSLVARRESRIGPEVSGRLLHIAVDAGDRVKAGQLLFEIDPSPFEIAVRQAEAGVALARAQVAQLEADRARAVALHERNVMAQQAYEKVRTSVEVAHAQLRQAQAQLDHAREQLEKTKVVAPYDASVVERREDEGTIATLMPPTVVVVLQETEHLEAHAAIPESQADLVRSGDASKLFVEGMAEPIEGVVASVDDRVDLTNRSYTARIEVPNTQLRLKSGLFVRVEIASSARRDVLVLPRDAVRSEDGRSLVFRVEDGHAASREVRLGFATGDSVEVLAGLAEGDRVVVGDAVRTLSDGTPIAARVVKGD